MSEAPANGDGSSSHLLSKLLDSGKFLMGTVVVAVVAPILNYQYQSAQLALEETKIRHSIELQDRQSAHAMKLEEKKAEVEYLGKFMAHAMTEDLKSRMRFAYYMRSIALSPNVQKAWLDYHKELEKESRATQNTIDTISVGLKEKGEKLAEVVKQNQVQDPATRSLVKEIEVATNSLYRAQERLDRQEFGKAEQRAVNFYELVTKADDAERLERFEEQRDLLLKAYQESPPAVHPYILTRLADAYRSLHQFELARKYMELALDSGPPSVGRLVSLAIMQKNDNKLPDALKTLERASATAKDQQKLEVELITAGYLIHAGKREEGIKRFEQIKSKLLASNDFAINLAWFYAVADRKPEFYEQLETALNVQRARTLVWINQEVDIEKFRGEERFKTLVANAKVR